MYKVFSNILVERMIHILDFHQAREQAGFRAGYSTIVHLVPTGSKSTAGEG